MAGPTSQTRLEAEAPELAGILRSWEGTVLDALGAGFAISDLRVMLEGLQSQMVQAVQERSNQGKLPGNGARGQAFSDTASTAGGQMGPPVRDPNVAPPTMPVTGGIG